MADDEEKPAEKPFLSRWSERKQAARETPPAVLPPVEADAPPPELPPVEQLTLESDFSGFMHPKVDADLRRAALRKLFSDPHFNVMDGLDTYIDDYSKPDPLPPGMLAGLRQAQQIFAWAKETKEETAARFAAPAATPAELPSDEHHQLTADTAVTPPVPVVAVQPVPVERDTPAKTVCDDDEADTRKS
jgi:hypothetical protein